jgi:membrane protein
MIVLSVPFALRWLVLAAAMMLSLAVLYRYAPCRRQPRWEWVSPGAVVATLLWLAGTGLFTLYVSSLGRFNHLYGALGAVVVLLLWLMITGHAVLLGAELNAEMEHQTRKDTT